MNHRAKHMAAHLEKRFKYADLLGFEKFYPHTGSSPHSFWRKKWIGFSNLLYHRVKISAQNSVRRIVVRDLGAPDALHLLIDDLWRYFLARQLIAPFYDVAILGNPRNALLGWFLKRSGRVKCLIYDDYDYRPGMENSAFARRVMDWRERFCVRHADGVICANALLADLRRRQGAKNVVVIPNGVDLASFASARQKSPHPPTLIYMGNVSMMWGLDLVIEAMARLVRVIPQARLLLAGTGEGLATLQSLSHRLGVAENVIFLGTLAYQALPSVLAEADVGIATAQPDNQFRKYATPLKLVEYMAAGLPVIASKTGQTEIMMQQADAGILINHSVEEFVAASINLLTDRALAERYSRAAIAYAARFDWSLLMEQVYQYTQVLLAGDQDAGGR